MGQRKKYDKAYKEQVVLRILAEETTIGEAAKELDIHYTTVRDWVKTYKRDGTGAFPGSGNLKAEDDEMRKLRKQLADLKEENEILKKRPRSGYYAYINRPESKRSIENLALLKTIKDIHTSSHRIYGSPQITKNLPPEQKASRGRVARLTP